MTSEARPLVSAEAPVIDRRFTLSLPDLGVPLLTGALALAAALVTLAWTGSGVHAALHAVLPAGLAWPLIAALYLAAEMLVVHLEIGRETHSFSLTEVPLVMGLFLGTPVDLVVGHVLGSGLALAFHRRQALRKLAFNVASFALSTSLAVVVFGFIVDTADPLGPRGWLAVGMAALTADLVSALNVQAVIAVSTGERFTLATPSLSGVRYSLVNACLGLVATVLLVVRPELVWVSAVLALALFGAYRVSVRERHKQHRLTGLQEATEDVQGELAGDVEARLLARAREMSGAARAVLVVGPSADGSSRWVAMGADWALSTGELRAGASPDDAPGAAVVDAWQELRRAGVALRGRPDRRRPGPGTAEDLMAAPIRHGDAIAGMLAIMGREGNVGGWPVEELPLLETLANHAGVTLRNRELLDGLAARAAENEWLARHDALTGLPDRAWFSRLAADAIEALPSGGAAGVAGAAILAIVPDSFQEVRETLGHAHADDVLRQLADRLRTTAGGAPLGRLDGDTFGLLVAGGADPLATAESLQAQLDRPFSIDGLQLALDACFGIAPAHVGEADLPTLLREAERAVVQARASGVPIATYRSDRDAHSPARLSLMGELRRAIDAGALTVHYQAKVRPQDGELLGAEALVRWFHPVRGPIAPDAFIPIAERTSLLRPLTMQVTDAAVRSCHAWRGGGRSLGVAVNLSPRNLLDAQLVGDVASALARTGLAAAALTLEITEGAVMADPARSMAALGSLRELGVRLAIDDYGAGHASLAWLRELPVHELKIDRSFIRDLHLHAGSQAIVRSTIDLAHDLGLGVVAEGVEDAWALDWLARHGCDAVQGFHVGRPESAAAFEARWMPAATHPGQVAMVSDSGR